RLTGAARLAPGGGGQGGGGRAGLVTAAAAGAAVRQVWPEVVITELGGESRDRSEENNEFPETRDQRFPASVGRVQAWVAGPGMGLTPEAAQRLADVLATRLPVLVDADGPSLLARRRDLLPRPAPTLLTPPPGQP